MLVTILHNTSRATLKRVAGAFRNTLSDRGFDARIQLSNAGDERAIQMVLESNLYVSMGWNIHVKHLLARCKLNGIPVIVLQDGCSAVGAGAVPKYGPGYLYCVAINGPAGYGEHLYETDLPSDRRDTLGLVPMPWHQDSSIHRKVVLAYQHASSAFGQSRADELRQIAAHIVNSRFKVHVRFHPSFRGDPCKLDLGIPFSYSLSRFIPLCHDLADARALVTIDSGTATLAALQGSPTFTTGTTMSKMVSHDLYSSSLASDILEPDREAWLNWMSYHHWTYEDIRDGNYFQYYFERRGILSHFERLRAEREEALKYEIDPWQLPLFAWR